MPRNLYRVQMGLVVLAAVVGYGLLRIHAVPQSYGAFLSLPIFGVTVAAALLFNRRRFGAIAPQPVARRSWIALAVVVVLMWGVLIPAVSFTHPLLGPVWPSISSRAAVGVVSPSARRCRSCCSGGCGRGGGGQRAARFPSGGPAGGSCPLSRPPTGHFCRPGGAGSLGGPGCW